VDGSGRTLVYTSGLVLKVALAACLFACTGLSAIAETGAPMIAIDRMMPGSPPAGFTFATTGRGGAGEWTVVEDPTASMGRALPRNRQ
jgi:hypothetical protein